jgi:hypothetical protein
MNTEALRLRHSKAGLFWRCALQALDLLRNLRAWLFVLPQAAASMALLTALLYFHRSPGNSLWEPIVRAIAGEGALHYPRFFRELPFVYSVLEGAVLWLLFPIGWAAFIHALPSLFHDVAPGVKESLRAGRERTLRIWCGLLPIAGIQILGLLLSGQMRTSDIAESPRLFTIAQSISFCVIALVQVLGAFVIPSIMLGNLSVPSAWVRSWEIVTRSFWTTAAFILLPRLLEVPVRLAIARLPEFWARLDPDSVGPLLAARILVTLAATFLTLAAISRFYLHLYGEDDS